MGKWRGPFLRGLLVLLLAGLLGPSLATNPLVTRRTFSVRNVINPTSQPGLQVYLLSKNVAGAADSALATWPDLSGNARDATQATAGRKPLIRDGVSPNGSRMIEFDGADDEMDGTLPAAGNVSIANGLTIYVYANETTTTTAGFDSQMIFSCGNSVSVFENYICTSAAIGAGYAGDQYGDNTGNARSEMGATQLGAQTLTWVYEPPAGAAAHYRLFRNGVQSGADDTNWQATDIRTSYTVGNSGAFNEGFKGYYGALLVYSNYHAPTTRTGIENYLRSVLG